MAALSEKFVRGLGRTIREYIDREIARHVEPLRRQLADVRKTSVRYRGTWQKAERYARGDEVTHADGRYYCTRDDPQERPGSGDAWQLTAKTYRPEARA